MLTAYQFACGYVEAREDYKTDSRLTLGREHSTYYVKGFVRGVHVWECFHTLREARKAFRGLWRRSMETRCICPEVWNGHGEPKPDSKRIDATCPEHGKGSAR